MSRRAPLSLLIPSVLLAAGLLAAGEHNRNIDLPLEVSAGAAAELHQADANIALDRARQLELAEHLAAKTAAATRYFEALAAQDAARAAQRAQEARSRLRAASAAPATVSRSAGTGGATGAVNGHPCGGDLPPCWVLRRETGGTGSPTAWNPTGCYERSTGHRGCGGKWQFSWSTWARYGGYETANLAPEADQDAKARLTWAGGRGCSHWAAC